MNKYARLKKLLALSLGLSLICSNISMVYALNSPVLISDNTSFKNVSNVIQADIKSERVPAGTTFKLRMETPVNSYNTTQGDTFRATLIEDIRIGTKVVIPTGTIVRGTSGEVKKNSYFSSGGWLVLLFDHIVTPMGKQIPLNVKISNAKYLTQKGTLSAGGGYMNAVGNSMENGTEFLAASTEYGLKAGKDLLNGFPLIITVPLGASVGLLGGAGIFTVESVVAMFKKGDNVRINPNDVIEVILKDPIDVPLN